MTYKHTLVHLEGATEKKQGGLLCGHCWDTYIQEPPVAEDAEQGVYVALTGEVEARPNVATRRQNSSGVPKPKPAQCHSQPAHLFHPHAGHWSKVTPHWELLKSSRNSTVRAAGKESASLQRCGGAEVASYQHLQRQG